MSRKKKNRFKSECDFLIYGIFFQLIVLLSCTTNAPLDISSGVSHDFLNGNWRCKVIHSRTWEHDSIVDDTIIFNDNGLFEIRFLDTIIITKWPSGDTIFMDTSEYSFTNNNLLYIIDNHPYFIGNLETIYVDTMLLLRDLAVSSSDTYPYEIQQWYEDVYYLENLD